ncbi:MAG: type IV-A pilus assembly ATPase PilB [Gammaproteobacteria bacterium]|nr:type IV-A pilus assembly ATPase PilB [Gammaproteobacteria bacterium]
MRSETQHTDDGGEATALDALAATAAEFGVPLLDLSAFDHASIPKGLLDEETIRRYRVLPLARRSGRLSIAIADPADLALLDEIKFHAGADITGVLVQKAALGIAIERYCAGRGDRELAELEGDDASPAAASFGTSERAVDEAPIVKYVHEVLADAVAAGASDIHFEPYENVYRIRVRVNGILREASRPPSSVGPRLAARLKVMSDLDVTERRVPQDGRIKFSLAASSGKPDTVDFRVSSLPTMHGEKMVLRILDQSSARLDVDQLGMEDDQRDRYLDALDQPQGMILVTGPTGSGKTVSLYAGLKRLNNEQRNIATAEDPVEINIEGINQVQVNSRVGLDFATALRAFLRQDPDVVMVGEVRDRDTADTAVKAAQTGHLVLSTLHTNSAAATLGRLRAMGVPAFNVATSVTLIVAQRLARVLCPACRRPFPLSAEVLLDEGFGETDVGAGIETFDAFEDGCPRCDHGYEGRTGIYEVVAVTPALRRLILEDASALELSAAARASGFLDLRGAGLNKVKRGITSLREINRVTARGES